MLRVFSLLAVLSVQIFAAPTYYWRSLPVGQPVTAQLLTLFCEACGSGQESGHDIPLVAVLRDTLGEQEKSNHRLTAVWLLSYSHPRLGQRALASIPFFYWSLNGGSSKVNIKDTKPLLDLSAPQHPAVANVERQILQWTALDSGGIPLRASSRAYRTNEVDHERLHLEEATSYLLHAPTTGESAGLSVEERDFVLARLELRKKLLGGFVNASKVATLGREAGYEQERVRGRNWELLRQCAEKTGLVFEPLSLGGSEENYGMLWYPVGGAAEPSGHNLGPIWKLLDIKDPYSDRRLASWTGLTSERSVDGHGLVEEKMIPLGVYSLSYPRQPLLLVDFRDKLNMRRHDLTQKAIDEVTSGIVGLSRFTNWYFYVASDAYSFVQERRGRANNRSERLDSYSEFRVSLALDRSLDPDLRAEMQKRAEALTTNPLESTPASEMAAAVKRYALLTEEARGDASRMVKRIDNQRREEIAGFGSSPFRQGMDITLHGVTLGRYTRRAPKDQDNLTVLSTYRRVQHNLSFLDSLVEAGTPPEIAYQREQVVDSVAELGSLVPNIESSSILEHAGDTLDKLALITEDAAIRGECEVAARIVKQDRNLAPFGVPGFLASPAPIVEPH